MGNLSYDDQQFNMIERAILGNGADANALTTYASRWYPKGPIIVKKFGLICTTALTGSGFTVSLKDAAGSTIATINASTTLAAGIASKAATGLTADTIIAGDYLTVTGDGTADAGSLIPFIDYVRSFNANHAI